MSWRDWTIWEWTPRLLEHYFGVSESSAPVESLLVTPDELARVVVDPDASPDEVETLFVQRVLTAVGENHFWSHAKQYASTDRPNYVAHLFVACLVATDWDAGEEDSYIERLTERTEPTRADLEIEKMAELWRCLVDYLDKRPDEYRQLILPDPGGWTRIGYTVKLAFPRRRDQKKLLRCLADAELLVADPPTGAVLASVDTMGAAEFSEGFRNEIDAFRKRWADPRSEPATLWASPFWAAVRSVATTSPGATQEARWGLVVEDDGYDLELLLVSNSAITMDALEGADLAGEYGDWQQRATKGSSGEDAVDDLFSGGLFIPGLSPLIRGGLVPLVEAAHGAWEASSERSAIPEARCALVRADLRDELLDRFGARARVRPSGVDDWVFVEGLRLVGVDAEEVDGTPLRRCLVIQKAPVNRRIQRVGGVRIGRAWLGLAGWLPRFEAEGALSLVAHRDGEEILLTADDGHWVLPDDDYHGPYELTAQGPDWRIPSTIEFVPAPTSERYRTLSTPDSWVYEDLAASRYFSERWSEPTSEPPLIPDAEDVVYLGRDVGVFVDDPADAAWSIVSVGLATHLHALLEPGDLDPRGRVQDAAARRRWRRLLETGHRLGDEHSRRVTGHVLGQTAAQSALPYVPQQCRPADVRPSSSATPHRGLEDVVVAVASVSNNQAGLERTWFVSLLGERFGLEHQDAREVLRAWKEAGLLDDIANVRWSGRKLLAIQPHLSATRTASGGTRAVLDGLALPTTRLGLRNAALESGLTVWEVPSRSPFVPTTIAVMVDSDHVLEEVAASVGLDIRPAPPEPFPSSPRRDLTGRPPKAGYEPATGSAEAVTGTAEIQRNWRRGAPSYWTVKTPGYSTWTHYYDAARFWAAAFTGPIATALDSWTDFTLQGVHLPLASARWLSALGAPRGGPRQDGCYVYAAPSTRMRATFLAELEQFRSSAIESMRQT